MKIIRELSCVGLKRMFNLIPPESMESSAPEQSHVGLLKKANQELLVELCFEQFERMDKLSNKYNMSVSK